MYSGNFWKTNGLSWSCENHLELNDSCTSFSDCSCPNYLFLTKYKEWIQPQEYFNYFVLKEQNCKDKTLWKHFNHLFWADFLLKEDSTQRDVRDLMVGCGLRSLQFLKWFIVYFVKKQSLKVLRTLPWALPAYDCECNVLNKASTCGQLFSPLPCLLANKPPEGMKFKAKLCFCCINIDRTIIQSLQMEILAHFQANLYFRLPPP